VEHPSTVGTECQLPVGGFLGAGKGLGGVQAPRRLPEETREVAADGSLRALMADGLAEKKGIPATSPLVVAYPGEAVVTSNYRSLEY